MNRSKRFSMKKLMYVLVLCLAFSLLLTGCSSKKTEGQADFPTQPLQITLPWAPGGSSDLTLRALAEIVGPEIGESVNITNREGAGGTIGIMEGANAASTGYEITFIASGAMVAQPHMREVQYENDDFKGIVGLTYEPVVLAVNADSDWDTLDDLIAEKNSNRIIKFAHSGAGGFPHVTQEAFFSEAGINAESVPFEGGGPAVTALLGGHVDTVAAHPAELIPHVESGDIRLLGVFSPERFELLEDVPTFKEKGFDLNMSVWKALVVPKDTPDDVVEKLRDIFTTAVNSTEYKEFLKKNSLAPIDIEPDEIVPRLNEEYESTGKVLENIGLKEY
ncbi:Bug family tripartite tricarboxylate transporter substrate binding protein [Virgibacillus ndiopensis]|uniref:Bug family tripartite tricarboxylate transporter substrate binding protein n=1 Tax=Virgibacillus ndiopensis TaxID=2004408 RepID=UPI000C085B9A|nr:tripartite tricarboxylate transporter substrate binding protein [Virgibacillus ndiopensis]